MDEHHPEDGRDPICRKCNHYRDSTGDCMCNPKNYGPCGCDDCTQKVAAPEITH